MNLDICRKCNQSKCFMFFKKDNGKCFADMRLARESDSSERNYVFFGMEVGVKMVTSDAVVRKEGDLMFLWKIPYCSGIVDYGDLASVPREIGGKWEFEKYVPYERCKDECPYWMEHKASSLASGEVE